MQRAFFTAVPAAHVVPLFLVQRLLMKPTPKYYAVRIGRQPGIVKTWKECREQVDGFPGNQYKSFTTMKDAKRYMEGGDVKSVEGTCTVDVSTMDNIQAMRSVQDIITNRMPISPETNVVGRTGGLKFIKKRPNPSISIHTQTTLQFKKKRPVESIINEMTNNQAIIPPPVPEIHHIYTDGACSSNGQAKAYAGYGVYFGENHPLNISEPLIGPIQTNNRAEMMAIIRALEIYPFEGRVIVYSDSKYVIQGVEKWMAAWKRDEWTKRDRREILNKDLWEKMDRLLSEVKCQVEFRHVKGHSGNAGNEAADALARAGAKMNQAGDQLLSIE